MKPSWTPLDGAAAGGPTRTSGEGGLRADCLKSLFRSLVAAVFMLCAAPARAGLSPAAQAAFDKGVIAAQQQAWEIAAQSFQEARKAAPDAPEILYNLGLAESKMPGRELRSMAWFAAYLAARPDAPNAAAVIAQIDALDVRSQSNLARLVNDAANRENMAAVLRIAGLLQSGWKQTAYEDVADADLRLAKAEAEFGDSTTAVAMVQAAQMARMNDCCASTNYEADENVAERLAEAGRFTAARQVAEFAEPTAGRWVEPSRKSRVWIDIAEGQMKSGDFGGASKTADRILVDAWKQQVKEEINIAKAAAGTPEVKAPMPTVAQTASAPEVIKAVFGEAGDGSGMLNAPIFLNPVDYLSSLNSADPHDLVTDFHPIRGIMGADDWASAGKPLVLFCALAQAAATMAEGQRTTEHYAKAAIAQTLARADRTAR